VSIEQSSSQQPSAESRRRRTILLVSLGVVAISAVGAAIWLTEPESSSEARRLFTVTRGDFVVTVTEQGTVESYRQTEINCEVRGGYGGRGGHSTVNWIIAPGSVVEKGAELVRLDTKVIEETVSLGKTDTDLAKAALARAEADLAKAELGVDAYTNGSYRSHKERLESQRIVARENLATSRQLLAKTESLFRRGFATKLEVEANEFTVRRAELELEVKETQLDVLERLTKEMNLETLRGELTASRERVKGRTAGLALEKSKLELAQKEFTGSTIVAPKSGLVIYPPNEKWRDTPAVTEGASVHNNQVLLVMPDLAAMQVKFQIHESIIHRVTAGLPARVSLTDSTIDGELSSVATVASPAGWWTGNAVKYDTFIKLPEIDGLKPGMSAEVEVEIARYRDVLSIPTSAVLESDEGHFCWVETSRGTARREVRLGDSNDASIIVESGIEEGDRVLLDPVLSVDEAREIARNSQVHTIARGDLLVTITEQGSLESSNNRKIKCRVRGNSTINQVIENGTRVQKGDVLVRLENKQIEDYLHERTKFSHLSRDAAIGFRAQATRAKLAISEYEEGRYRTELMELEKDLAIANSNLLTNESLLAHARAKLEKGYESELNFERVQLAARSAREEIEIKKIQIQALKDFTSKEQLTKLRGDWEAAKASADANEEVLRRDEIRMELAEKEIELSVIRAEESGLVIYPTMESWKRTPDIAEGATVHQNQTLLLMPDLSKMQVKLGIHESVVDRVAVGMPARVTLSDAELEGEISHLATTAQPATWWTGGLVKYEALVPLPSIEGLKPGMSAEVEITIARHDDVLLIPLAAIEETPEGTFCHVGAPRGAERRSIEIGDSNDEFAVVMSGLDVGEQVVLDGEESSEK